MNEATFYLIGRSFSAEICRFMIDEAKLWLLKLVGLARLSPRSV